MDEEPICPPWWPKTLWDLHYLPLPFGHGPINIPRIVNDIMATLTIHTMSYMLEDQEEAQRIRDTAEEQLVKYVQNLSKSHDEAVVRKQSGVE